MVRRHPPAPPTDVAPLLTLAKLSAAREAHVAPLAYAIVSDLTRSFELGISSRKQFSAVLRPVADALVVCRPWLEGYIEGGDETLLGTVADQVSEAIWDWHEHRRWQAPNDPQMPATAEAAARCLAANDQKIVLATKTTITQLLRSRPDLDALVPVASAAPDRRDDAPTAGWEADDDVAGPSDGADEDGGARPAPEQPAAPDSNDAARVVTVAEEGEPDQGASSQRIRCPECGSERVVATRDGFSLTGAIFGVLTGGLPGLLIGGEMLSGDITLTCLDCDSEWSPDEMEQE